MHFVRHTHTRTALLAARTLQVSPCPLLINNITSGRDLRLMRPHACSQHVFACTYTHPHTRTDAHTQKRARKNTQQVSRHSTPSLLGRDRDITITPYSPPSAWLTSVLSGQQVIGEAVAHQPPPLRVPSVSSLFIIFCTHPGFE